MSQYSVQIGGQSESYGSDVARATKDYNEACRQGQPAILFRDEEPVACANGHQVRTHAPSWRAWQSELRDDDTDACEAELREEATAEMHREDV